MVAISGSLPLKNSQKKRWLQFPCCVIRRLKKLLKHFYVKKQLSHGRLACEVSVTSQALTWQMKTLKSTEYVVQMNEGLKIVYSLDEDSAHMLKKYLAIVK